ncbi:Ldh family oxidoreductase [Agromyces bauzanensis]
MEISLDELRVRVLRAFGDLGVPAEEAEAAADMCIDAELREHRSHGVRLLRNIATEYRQGAPRRGPIRVENETPASATVDGGYHLSPYVHRMAVDLLAEKTATTGIAMVGVRHAGVSGALGYLVERIAAQGFVGIALNSTPLVVVAPGTTDPMLGTNPLAIGLPRPGAHPLVLDMATSAIAFNNVMRLRALGGALPEGVALDEHGDPTTDPHAAVDAQGRGRVLPFGGHRGFGLALMIELIASGYVTGRTGAIKRGDVLHEPDDFGGLYLAFDPALLGDEAAANTAIEGLLGEIVAAGGRLPGEQSRLIRDAHLAAGKIVLDENAVEVLDL